MKTEHVVRNKDRAVLCILTALGESKRKVSKINAYINKLQMQALKDRIIRGDS
jgi:hypothetical protein